MGIETTRIFFIHTVFLFPFGYFDLLIFLRPDYRLIFRLFSLAKIFWYAIIWVGDFIMQIFRIHHRAETYRSVYS